MYGHAYFDQAFTNKFRPVLEDYFGRSGVEGMYWENIWAENIKEIPLWIQKYTDHDILEFDSMAELKAFDPNYICSNRIHIFENICRILCCEITDIQDMSTIKEGLNNQSFKFRVNGEYFIYRHPGINASDIIDRKKEAAALRVAKRLKIDETLIYIDEEEGWKISKFVNTTEMFSFEIKRHIDMLAYKLKTLHDSQISVGFGFDYKEESNRIIEILKHLDAMAYRSSLAEKETMVPVFDFLEQDKWQISLCHNDLYGPNLLVDGDILHLIDWEFAGDLDIGFDVCKLFAVHNAPYEEIDYWVEQYFGRETTREEKRHMIACAAVIYYYWYVWGIYASKNNQNVLNYMIDWHDKMNSFRNKALEMLNIADSNN